MSTEGTPGALDARADLLHRGGGGLVVGAHGRVPELRPHPRRLEIGEPVDVDALAAGLQLDRDLAARESGAQVHAAPRQERRAEADPLRAVVVAGDGDHRDPHVEGDPLEEVREEDHRVLRGHGPIEEIAGDEEPIHPLLHAEPGELVERVGLRFEQRVLVEAASQMPIGRVDESHVRPLLPRRATLAQGADITSGTASGPAGPSGRAGGTAALGPAAPTPPPGRESSMPSMTEGELRVLPLRCAGGARELTAPVDGRRTPRHAARTAPAGLGVRAAPGDGGIRCVAPDLSPI